MTGNIRARSIACNRLVVIGLGLIGASAAKAARDRGLCNEVIGISRRDSTLEIALQQGVIDRAESSLSALAHELGRGDMVLISVPTLTVSEVLEDCYRLLSNHVTITDAASVKGNVVDMAKAIYGQMPEQLVPGHPIAGSEKSGVNAAQADLYVDHRVILTPVAETGVQHLQRVTALWQGVGASVTCMPVARHDEILAATSHLPHLLAYALVDSLARGGEHREIFRFAAGGFRDFTRIAASDPVMWRDITVANRDAILSILDPVLDDFAALRDAIDRADQEALVTIFTRARDARHYFEKLLENKFMDASQTRSETRYRVSPGGHSCASLRVPGDKSISHRSIMLGAIAEGMTEVTGFLEGEDSLATLRAFRDLGVLIEGPDQGRLVIHGVGLNGLRAPTQPLYLGNSGTSMRLLSGLLAGQTFDVELIGDASLSGRPMDRVAEPLRHMGAVIETAEGGRPPLKIRGGQTLSAIDYQMPMASAQVKSCLLLAGLYADGITTVREPAPTRDHTERMLRGFGYAVESADGYAVLRGCGRLKARRIDVPADISSAAFFMVAAAITPGSNILLEHIGVNPTRTGIITILRLMGAEVELLECREIGGEPVADIRVRYGTLVGIDIPEAQVALAIDEFPVVFVAAACASGRTRLSGAAELRVKESDRIQVMADGLKILGIAAQPTIDGMHIDGGVIGAGEVNSHGDHRIAMAFSIAALRSSGEILISNCNNVATSFPEFVDLARCIGLDIRVEAMG